jgi:hypothetical protein
MEINKLAAVSIGGTLAALLPLELRALCVLSIAFMAMDFIIGIIVSVRIRKTGFESRRAQRSVFKFAGAITCILMAYHFEHIIFTADTPYLARTMTGIICAFDFWSVLANFAILSNHPVFRVLKRFLKSEIETKLKITKK